MQTFEQLDSGILIPSVPTKTDSGYRADAWTNNMSGQGVAGIDKTLNTTYTGYGTYLDKSTLEALYRADWLSRKICMRPAKDATRKFIQIKDQKIHEAVEEKFKGIGVRQKIKNAVAWGRLFGGAGIVMITKDSDPLEPFECNGEDKLVDIELYDRYELSPVAYDTDYESSNYMKPLVYQTRTGKQFHYTRICFFMGAELTSDQMRENLWWGGSYVETTWQAIKNLQSTYDDIRFILSELNIGILKIPKLTETMVQKNAKDVVEKRVSKFNTTKSNQRVAAIDSLEEFQFINRTVAGVNDLVQQFKTAAGAASEMGELVLFGESPSGFGGSQEELLATYYDMVSDIREDQIAPCVDKLLCASGFDVQWGFESLYEMSDTEKSQIMMNSAQAVAALMQLGLTPEDAMEQLNGLSVWTLEVDPDVPKVG